MSTVKQLYGTINTVLSTELNSIANNALVLSSETNLTNIDYLECDVEVVCTFTSSPTLGTGFTVWFLRKIDETNYEDGGTSVTPQRSPDLCISVRVVATQQRICVRGYLPPGNFKVLIKNDATGQALAASGNTFKIRPRTYSVV